MREIAGKVAWITGAGSGIGEAAALALAGAGMHVVLSGRRMEALGAVAQKIEAAGGTAMIEVLDVADRDAVYRVAERIAERFDRLDMLVNNAGINIPQRNWGDVTLDGWEEIVNINLNGAFYCIAAALPMMRRQQDGLVVTTASWAGKYVLKFAGPAYNATKHAVVAMSESLNKEECGNGIRATAVCPAEVATPIMDKRPVPVPAEDRAKMVQPEEMGELMLFLARLPETVCLNEVIISPTYNRIYIENLG
ncbi:SDR family oxidoreductase [Marinibaculum pumilum]|uniref:SDR family oxidoreductase n=1 Tax=Marinibaculum pumilum TaxID=1766165 RepID=A0ABV7KVF2_9PROT